MSEAAPRPTWRRVTGSVWFQLLLAFVVVGLLLTFDAKPYVVPSESMQGTLEPGDRVLVNRLAYVGSEPATGDIVVFDADESWGEHAAGDGRVGDPEAVVRTAARADRFGDALPQQKRAEIVGFGLVGVERQAPLLPHDGGEPLRRPQRVAGDVCGHGRPSPLARFRSRRPAGRWR